MNQIIPTPCDAVPPQTAAFAASAKMLAKLKDKSPYPISASIELTHQCNLSCPHCYVPPKTGEDDLSTDEIIDVLDQLSEMNVMFLSLTGGEPTVRTDFFDILRAAVERRFVVLLKSNGSLLTPAHVKQMADEGVYELNVSLYHSEPEKHDRFVGMEGAWKTTIDAVRLFKDLGRTVKVSAMLMDWNVENAKAMEDLFQKESWPYTMDFQINRRNDGDKSPEAYRAKADELVETICRSQFLSEQFTLRKGQPPAKDAPVCGVGHTMVIQPNGNVIPCVPLTGVSLGNVRTQPIADIWTNSQKTREGLKVCWQDNAACLSCENAADCFRCPATAMIEKGVLTEPSTLECELADIRHRARIKLQNNDS